MDRVQPDIMVLTAVRAVSQLRGPTVADLLGLTRRHEVVRARNLAIYALYRTGRYSTGELGAQFGRDHTTILHSMKSFGAEVHQQTRRGETLRKELAEVTSRINQASQEALELSVLRKAGFTGFWVVCSMSFQDPAGLAWLRRQNSRFAASVGTGYLVDLRQPVPQNAPKAIHELFSLPTLGVRFLFLDSAPLEPEPKETV